MNYGYIFIDNLNGHVYDDGFNQLKKSISVLKKTKIDYDNIYIFNNEKEGKVVDYCKQENLVHIYINLSRRYDKSDTVNPISILVEKIIALRDFDLEKDIVLLDIDTTFISKPPVGIWNNSDVVLNDAEYYLTQWRNLDKVLPKIPWNEIEISFKDDYIMYNTGVIYIPRSVRKKMCEKALWIVDYLNANFGSEERMGNKLDEQIAFSVVLHHFFGTTNNIKLARDFIYHYWKEKQQNIRWWEDGKLPISIGILSWNNNISLENSLKSYQKNGLFDLSEDVTIYFQEINDEKISIAKKYGLNCIGSLYNVGIGSAFYSLVTNSKNENVLLLEHDWELTESVIETEKQLKEAVNNLDEVNCVRLRSRKNPGEPLYSRVYEGNELNFYDKTIDLISPGLFDCIHWIPDPEQKFSDKIEKKGEYFYTTSRWSNFTNNPCLYKKNFYLEIVHKFKDVSLNLENDISYWWARQNFKICWGSGLFTHCDLEKYE